MQREGDRESERERERDPELQPPFGLSVGSLCHPYITKLTSPTSSTAQGGGGSFKDRKL